MVLSLELLCLNIILNDYAFLLVFFFNIPEYFPPRSLTKRQTFINIIINNPNATIKPINHGSLAIFLIARA